MAEADNSGENTSEQQTSQTPQSSVDWREAIPKDYRESTLVKESKDAASLWNQIGNMQERLGRSVTVPNSESGAEEIAAFRAKVMSKDPGLVALPGEDDDGSGWAALFNQLGRPEQATGYSGDLDADTAQLYHDLGLSDAQAARLAETDKNAKDAASEQSKAARKEGMEKLFKDWGNAKQRKEFGIQKALARFDKDGAIKEFLASDSEHVPAFLRVIGNVGDMFIEQGAHDGDEPASQFGTTPAEAKEKINSIRNNPKDPWHNPMHPDHENRVKEMTRLYQQAYPSNQEPGSDLEEALLRYQDTG